MFPDEADLVESLVNETFTEIPIAGAPSGDSLSCGYVSAGWCLGSQRWWPVEPQQTFQNAGFCAFLESFIT